MEHYDILPSVNGIEDLKRLPEGRLDSLAAEIRDYMIENVARTGGHLASSLGAVELTIAIHRVFNSPKDRIVFDVGHQAYAHKILTGRRDAFATLRKQDGVSGFPKRSESVHDAFNTGHASTSISAAHGVAVAVIGDGAMTGGLAYEALNDAGQANVPIIVVLNDNDMSISPNVGAMRRALTNMRTSRKYIELKRSIVRRLDTGRVGKLLSKYMENFKNRIKSFLLPDLLFEELGFLYLGPIDGHNIPEMTRMLTRAKELHAAVLVHVVTQKGKGYAFSEDDPEKFHGIAPFAVNTGLVEHAGSKNNSTVCGEALIRLAEKDARIVAITAAMPTGTGLSKFEKRFPERFFDVGIAEEHAVTMAAGMATGGLRPVVALYSTFLQRAYDELLHDVCLQNLPVVIGVDRAGLVGDDGETHQGIYDIAFLSSIPNLSIYSPATQQELVHMLSLALSRVEPAVIRYNRGSLMQSVSSVPVEYGCWEELLPIAECTVIATGCMVGVALPEAKRLGAGLINARFIRPVDERMLERIKKTAKRVIVAEEGVVSFGMALSRALYPLPVTCIGLPVAPIPQGSVAQQRTRYGVAAADIARAIEEQL